MPRKLNELILPWERVFAVPGLQSVWSKRALIEIPPLCTDEIRLQTPTRIEVVVKNVEIYPLVPMGMQFLTIDFILNGSAYRPEGSIFRPIPGDSSMTYSDGDGNAVFPGAEYGVHQFENVNMMHIDGGCTFGWRFTNISPVFVVPCIFSARIFTERQAN
jgi:hypothetical protein